MAAYDHLGSKVVAVKSQIHAGGRGKGNLYAPDSGDLVMEGGVKIAFSKDEVKTYATNILGNILVTIQTGDRGKLVRNLYVESGCDIAHEYYLAILVDRENKSVLIMASTEGGMDIEHVAETTPEKIHKISVDPNTGLLGYQKRDLGLALGLTGAAHKAFSKALTSMYSMFVSSDCAMLEINPLVRTAEDDIVALDAKVSFDENAEFRHKDWDDLRDLSEEEEVEIRAKETGLSYVKLDGNIGCLVNGAGLAMATMDVIKLYDRLFHHSRRPQRQGHSRQHFRWHHALRHHRPRRDCRHGSPLAGRAARRSPRRDQRGPGQSHPRSINPQHSPCRRPCRGSAENCGTHRR